jgi:hypothetical protein
VNAPRAAGRSGAGFDDGTLSVPPGDWRETTPPAGWLAPWAQGYCDGYEAATAGALPVVLLRLAEDLDQLDRTTFVNPARFSREQRIAREVADDRHQIRVRFDDPHWPPVTVPGVPTVRVDPGRPGETSSRTRISAGGQR